MGKDDGKQKSILLKLMTYFFTQVTSQNKYESAEGDYKICPKTWV